MLTDAQLEHFRFPSRKQPTVSVNSTSSIVNDGGGFVNKATSLSAVKKEILEKQKSGFGSCPDIRCQKGWPSPISKLKERIQEGNNNTTGGDIEKVESDAKKKGVNGSVFRLSKDCNYYHCLFCTYWTQSGLDKHVKGYHPYHCVTCRRTFDSQKAAAKHSYQHRPVHICMTCNRSLSSERAFQAHLHSQHHKSCTRAGIRYLLMVKRLYSLDIDISSDEEEEKWAMEGASAKNFPAALRDVAPRHAARSLILHEEMIVDSLMKTPVATNNGMETPRTGRPPILSKLGTPYVTPASRSAPYRVSRRGLITRSRSKRIMQENKESMKLITKNLQAFSPRSRRAAERLVLDDPPPPPQPPVSSTPLTPVVEIASEVVSRPVSTISPVKQKQMQVEESDRLFNATPLSNHQSESSLSISPEEQIGSLDVRPLLERYKPIDVYNGFSCENVADHLPVDSILSHPLQFLPSAQSSEGFTDMFGCEDFNYSTYIQL